MKFPIKSIRWRLQAWYGMLLLFVLLAFGGTSYYFARENRFRIIERGLWRECIVVSVVMPRSPQRDAIFDALRKVFVGRLQSELHDLSGIAEVPAGTNVVPLARPLEGQPDPGLLALLARSEQAGYYFVVWRPDGSVLQRSGNLPAGIPKSNGLPRQEVYTRVRDGFQEQSVMADDGTQLLVGYPITAELAALHQLALRLSLAGGIMLTLGLAGGWWVAGRAIHPIKEISSTAGKIAAGNLAERINILETDSELGQLAGVLNASFDQVQAAFNQLQAALDLQVRFTADASHELRTPVSVILAEANSALARERTPAEYKEALESCQNAARRMRRLTESLLTLARLDSGEQPGRREPCDLQLVALEAIHLLRPLADERGVTLHAQVSTGACLADSEQLGQVVTNLVSNAIQYNRPGGDVRIRVISEGDRTVLNVMDTGLGIAPEDLPHVFDRFYRADQSRSQSNGHMGLGLAITKAIVEAHGGTIQASSEAGAGSTFTVSFQRLE